MEMFVWNRFIDVTSFHPLQESQRLFSMKSPWGQSADILTLSIFDLIILNYYKILFCHLSLVAGLIKKLSFLCRLLQNKIPSHWTELNSIHKCVLIYEHICRKLVSSLLNDIIIFLFCFYLIESKVSNINKHHYCFGSESKWVTLKLFMMNFVDSPSPLTTIWTVVDVIN